MNGKYHTILLELEDKTIIALSGTKIPNYEQAEKLMKQKIF